MERLINRLRQIQLRWAVVLALAAVMVIITVITVNGIRQATSQARGVASERSRLLFESEERRDGLQLRLNNAGSDQSIVETAAQQGMTFSGSIRFTVLNEDALEKYTAEEYQRYIEEMGTWD